MTEQLEAILLHELAHIRRMDYLVNLLQRLVEAILFYHPAVWFISRQIRNERENCCDDVTLAACADPTVYAEALLAVAGPAAPRLALAATGGQLLPRIRRILGDPGSSPSVLLSGGLALLFVVGIVVVPIAMLRAADGTPAATTQQQPQNPAAGAKLDPGAEEKLQWGEPVNGLRAALEISPSHDDVKRALDLYLVVQNVSKAPIHLNDTTPLSDKTIPLTYDADSRKINDFEEPHRRGVFIMLNGRKDEVEHIDNHPTMADVMLQPREVAFLLMFTPDAKNPAGRTPGSTIAADARSDPHETLFAVMKIDEAPAGAWTGKLVTPETTGAVAAGKPAVPATTAPATAPPSTRAAAPSGATASATQTAAATQPAPWGEAVGGIQLRLTPEKAIWKKAAGSPDSGTLDLAKPADAERFIENNSALNLDIRNTANFALPLNNLGPNYEFVQIEYDGKLYDYFGGIAPKFGPVQPGDTINTSLFPREGDLQWGSYPDFKPGTHTIRMVLAYGDEKIFSNPVTVEIAASQPVATAPAASKGQDAVRAAALDKLEKLLKEATPKGWTLARNDGKIQPNLWVGVGEGTEFVMTKVPPNGDIMLHLWLMKPEYQGHVLHPVMATTNVTKWQGGMAIQYGGIDSTSWSGGYHPPEDYPWVPVRKAVAQALAATAVTTVADAAQDLIENTKSPELQAAAATTQPAVSKPAVKDGLQVTVTLPKATFAADEPLKFVAQFKNVSDRPHDYYGADDFWSWTIRFQRTGEEKAGAGGSWLLVDTAKDRERLLEQQQRHTLKAGETFDVPVDLDKAGDFAFAQDDQQLADLKPIKRLQPGRYQLVMEIQLTGVHLLDRLTRPGGEWIGQITTNPVEFEITDKEAATQAATALPATASAPAVATAMTEEQVVAEIEKLGGTIRRIGDKPDGPVIAIAFFPPNNTKVTNAELEHLKVFSQLQYLDLNDTIVTDAGLENLKGLSNLKGLLLIGTKVSDEGVKKFKEALPKCDIFLHDDMGPDRRLDSSQTLEPPAATQPAAAPAMTEEQVVTEIEKLGGKVTKDGNTPDGLVVAVTFAPIRVGRVPVAPNVIDAVLEHLNGLTQLKSVDLSFSEVSDAGLAHLQGLNQLQTLNLDNTKVTDAGLAHIKGLTHLQTLDLDDTQVTDAGLEQLAALNQLQELSLNRTNVTDAGLVHLQGFHQLQELLLSGDTKVTDAGVAQLAGLKQLQVLYLPGAKVTDAGLAHLEGLSQLQQLNMEGTNVTDAGLAHLQGLAQLQALYLPGTKITDAGLAHLEGLKQLHVLILEKLGVTDAGLAHLAGLNQLRTLDLSGTNITDAGLGHLEGLNQLQWLGLGQTNLTDAGLVHIKVLNQLGWVDLQGTKVTDQGIKQLEDALPKWKLARHMLEEGAKAVAW